MGNLPVEAYYFMAGGIAYLIIKDVFAFVKVVVGRFNGNGKTDGQSDGAILTQLQVSIDEVIIPRLTKVEEAVESLSRAVSQTLPLQKVLEGKICRVSNDLSQLSRDFETTRRECVSRFAKLETVANTNTKTRRGNDGRKEK